MADWGRMAALFGAGLIQGTSNAVVQANEREQSLLVNSINAAVQSGDPQALALLNPEVLARHRLDALMPMYAQMATSIGKQKQLEQRRVAAAATAEESRARVATQTESQQVGLVKSQAQAAQQKVQMGELDLTNAEHRQKFIEEDPKLLMLPEQQQITSIQNMKSQMTARAEQTKLGWASLGQRQKEHAAQLNALSGDRMIKQMQAKFLAELPEEQRAGILEQMLTPGVESAIVRSANQYQLRLDSSHKAWQSVAKAINDSATKEEREALVYKTEEAALGDLTRLNTAAFQHNTLAEQAEAKFGTSLPRLPVYEVTKIPGLLRDEWRLVEKSSSLMDEIQQFLGTGLQQTPKVKTEKPEPAMQKKVPASKPEEGATLTPGGVKAKEEWQQRMKDKVVK